MDAPCAYHPDRASVDTCVECNNSVCAECKTVVAEKTVCRRCVEAIRNRVATEMGAGLAPVGGESPASPGMAPASTDADTAGVAYTPPPTMQAAAAPAVELPPLTPARLLVGLALGAVAGLIGAFIWDKVVFYTNFQIGFLAIFIGYGVGFAVLLGTGRGGLIPGVLGGSLAFATMVFSRWLLVGDVLAKEFNQGQSVQLPFTIPTLVAVMQTLELWIGSSWPSASGAVSRCRSGRQAGRQQPNNPVVLKFNASGPPGI